MRHCKPKNGSFLLMKNNPILLLIVCCGTVDLTLIHAYELMLSSLVFNGTEPKRPADFSMIVYCIVLWVALTLHFYVVNLLPVLIFSNQITNYKYSDN